jgi:heptosyltransferase-2
MIEHNVAVKSNNKILIIRFSSIGDILLSTPFIRQVKNTFTDARIDFVVKEEFKVLLDNNPYLNTVYTYQKSQGIKGLWKLKKELEKCCYDYVFDLHNNFRSTFLRKALNVDNTNFIHKDKFIQILYVYLKVYLYKKVTSIPLRYLEVGNKYGVKDDKKGLELYWKSENEKKMISLLRKYGIHDNENYLCVAPGASFYTKRWPLENFTQLIKLIQEQYHYKIVVLGGDNEIDLGKYLSRNNDIIDFTGKLDLSEVGIIISKSKSLISNDSGLMHIATAVKTPVLALFGSSVEEFGFFPYRSRHYVFQNHAPSCRPCSHIGRKKCPKEHFKCMRDLSAEAALQKLNGLIV